MRSRKSSERFGGWAPAGAAFRCPGAGAHPPSVRRGIIVAVPRIRSFYGIVIEMYYGDHPPPHFHARYAGEAAKIQIADGAVVAGSPPGRALRLVREWTDAHRHELEANWERAVSHK